MTACGKGGGGSGADYAAEFMARDQMQSHLVDGYANLRKYDYAIDDELNLAVAKEIRLELFPQVLGTTEKDQLEVDSSCAHLSEESCGRPKLKPLRPGLYLMRYTLLRNSFEESESAYQLLHGGEKIVEVTPSNLIATIQLKINDLRLMGSRNHLLIEISAIDESKVKKVALEEWVPLNGASNQSLIDQYSNMHPLVFESSLDNTPAPRLIFAPFDLGKLEKTLERQTESFRPWVPQDILAKEKEGLPRFIHSLGDVNQYVGAFERLEQSKQKNLKSHYAEMQNLIDWKESSPEFEKVQRAELLNVLKTKTVNSALYEKLCWMWAKNILPGLASDEFNRSFAFPDKLDFVENCAASHGRGLEYFDILHSMGLRYRPFFVFQDVISVDSAKLDKLLPGGKNLTLQLTDKFYLRSRHEYNYEYGFRPLSWIPLIGPYLSLAGTMAVDSSLKEDNGNELRFQTNMQLNVEQNTVALNLNKYQHCLIVRMNADRLKSSHISLIIGAMENEVKQNQMARALTERGLLVCAPSESTPIQRQEKFFFISSNTKDAGFQQDPTDIRNRAISLSLRGERDFGAFMMAGKAQLTSPHNTSTDFGGVSTAMAAVEGALTSVTPAAAGIFVEDVFY